jgi:hypothetical protein
MRIYSVKKNPSVKVQRLNMEILARFGNNRKGKGKNKRKEKGGNSL